MHIAAMAMAVANILIAVVPFFLTFKGMLFRRNYKKKNLLLFGKVQQACSDRFSYILCHSLVSKYIVNIFLLFCRGVGALQLFDGGEVGGGVLSAAWQVGNVDGGNRCVGFQAEAEIVEPGW